MVWCCIGQSIRSWRWCRRTQNRSQGEGEQQCRFLSTLSTKTRPQTGTLMLRPSLIASALKRAGAIELRDDQQATIMSCAS